MTEKNTIIPPVDIYETEDKYVLVADMPGVEKEDIDISVSDGTLTLTGKVKERDAEWKPVVENSRLHDYPQGNSVGNKWTPTGQRVLRTEVFDGGAR
jgi:hypothetical protein